MSNKIEKAVLDTYKSIEETVVGTYQKVEDTVVGTYQKVENAFVERFLAKPGESVEEARERTRSAMPVRVRFSLPSPISTGGISPALAKSSSKSNGINSERRSSSAMSSTTR